MVDKWLEKQSLVGRVTHATNIHFLLKCFKECGILWDANRQTMIVEAGGVCKERVWR